MTLVLQNLVEVGDLQVFWLDRNLAPRDEFDGDTTRARVELLEHMTRRAIKRSVFQADQLDPRADLIRRRGVGWQCVCYSLLLDKEAQALSQAVDRGEEVTYVQKDLE